MWSCAAVLPCMHVFDRQTCPNKHSAYLMDKVSITDRMQKKQEAPVLQTKWQQWNQGHVFISCAMKCYYGMFFIVWWPAHHLLRLHKFKSKRKSVVLTGFLTTAIKTFKKWIKITTHFKCTNSWWWPLMLHFTENKKFDNKCPSFSPDPHLKCDVAKLTERKQQLKEHCWRNTCLTLWLPRNGLAMYVTSVVSVSMLNCVMEEREYPKFFLKLPNVWLCIKEAKHNSVWNTQTS